MSNQAILLIFVLGIVALFLFREKLGLTIFDPITNLFKGNDTNA